MVDERQETPPAEGPVGQGPPEKRQEDRRSEVDRRRGPGRRRSDDRRSAEEGEMTADQLEFLHAVNEYKRSNRRAFPTWTEVLDVVKALGYRKVAEPGKIQ